MKILHICDGWETTNGAANIARLIAGEQASAGHEVAYRRWANVVELRSADEVWIHCGWKPCLWWAAFCCSLVRNIRICNHRDRRPILSWVPEACYDPIRRRYHGWKKTLVGPIERWVLRRCDRIAATCTAEAEWVRTYLGIDRLRDCSDGSGIGRRPEIVVTDIKRFFRIEGKERREAMDASRPLHLLYLGRHHPLKGLEYLEQAVAAVNRAIDQSGQSPNTPIPAQSNNPLNRTISFRAVSNAFGAEKEKVWAWCDVLVLPTLSDNFGLVVAEALERGKTVITTDGAPVWEPKSMSDGEEIGSDYGGRLLYLRGYRDGDATTRIRLLKAAVRFSRGA